MYQINHMPSIIEIGITGEMDFRPIQIDMTAWMDDIPNGVPSIVHIRPGETADDAYIAATTFADNILTWYPTEADLGTIEGYGTMEVWLEKTQSDTVVKRGKSLKVQTYVRESIAQSASDDPPEAQEAWLEQMTELKTATVEAAEDAEDSAEDAEAYAVGKRGGVDVTSGDPAYHNNAKYYSEAANTSATNAGTAYTNADNAKTDAIAAKNAAVTAKGEAETAQLKAEVAQGKAENAQEAAETAQGKAEDAQEAAETAQGLASDYADAASGSATTAGNKALVAEGYAVGKQNGADVASGSDYYHNNAKYYSEQAASATSSKADKSGTVLSTTLSRGRKANTTVGTRSFAFGNDVSATNNDAFAIGSNTTASGNQSFAAGTETVASGSRSFTTGNYTTANHANQVAFGTYNVPDPNANGATYKGDFIEIVGNGTGSNAKSNARALDWSGNEYLKGDLYVGANADSTGGSKVAKNSDVLLKADKVTDAVSGNLAALDANGNLTDSGSKVSDFAAASGVHNVPSGGSEGQVLAKNSGTDYDLKWVNQSGGGGGTSDYDDLTDKPQINSVTLSGNKSSTDLGIIDDTAGDGDTEKTFSADKLTDELTSLSNEINGIEESIAPVESSTTATSAHAVGELFMLNDSLLVALSAIAVGDTITTTGESPNAAVTTLSAKMLKDVQVNGTSITQNGVANIPYAANNVYGVFKTESNYGIIVNNSGRIYVDGANTLVTKTGTDQFRPIIPAYQHYSVFYALAKLVGADMKNSNNTLGVYTEDAKSGIADLFNAPETVSGSTPSITAKSGVRYICGEVSTLTIVVPASGIIDVTFESGSTPTVLTVTPPTGVTIKWANGFDPTALEANTTYEINVMDGEYGVVGEWN